jgi:hypothetical protein
MIEVVGTLVLPLQEIMGSGTLLLPGVFSQVDEEHP